MNTLNIKCPVCGAVLTVPAQPGMESKNVTCPVCKNKNSFPSFQQIKADAPLRSAQSPDQEPPTEYGGKQKALLAGHDNHANYTLGILNAQNLGEKFQLKPGMNVIGRKAPSSSASVQIPCPTGDKRMSREHIIIEIKKVAGKGFVHYLSLYKEKVNKTYLGNSELSWGDKIVLQHNDIVRLPGVSLRFEIPQESACQ